MSLVNILYVRGNSGDMDDTEYYVEHVFAVYWASDGCDGQVDLKIHFPSDK